MYRLLIDESVEHEVYQRLENYGHEVEYVDFVGSLGPGSTDSQVAAYAQETDRLIVTYDDDFWTEPDATDHAGVLAFEDATISAKGVADILHAASEHVPQDEIRGVRKLGREWLS
jgi:hypothetical protein